jgi:signal transduction histidine kinase
MQRPLSQRRRALVAFTLVALVPTVVLGTFGAVAIRGLSALARSSARATLEKEFTQGLVIRVAEKAGTGDALFRGALSQAITLSQFASAHLPDSGAGSEMAFADPLLSSIQQSTPGAFRAWLTTVSGGRRGFPSSGAGWEGSPPTFPTWSRIYNDPSSDRPLISALAPVYGADRKIQAVAGVDLLLSSVLAAVLFPGGEPGQYDLLLDQGGWIVNLNDTVRTDLGLPGAAQAPDGRSQGVSLSDSGDANVRSLDMTLRPAVRPGLTKLNGPKGTRYIAYASMPVTGWVLARVVSETAIAGETGGVETAVRRREALFLVGGAAGLALLIPLMLFLASRASRNLADPAARLAEASRRLARDLSYRVTDPFPEELAALAHALNSMAASLEHSRDEAVRSARMVAEERNRLAREIHDTLAQGLTAIVVQLQTAEDILGEAAPPDALQRLARARQVARESLAEARRSVWNLRPFALSDGGLPHALSSLRPGMEAEGIACTMDLQTGLQLSEAVEDALFRICQEALANVRKHSGATQVSVTLRRVDRMAELQIRDNGRGFDPEALAGPQPAGGFGLWAIRSRLAGVGGTVTVDSRIGAGTTVRATVPIGGNSDGSGDQGAGG